MFLLHIINVYICDTFAVSLWISALRFQIGELPIATVRKNALFFLCWLKYTSLCIRLRLAQSFYTLIAPGLIHVIHS